MESRLNLKYFKGKKILITGSSGYIACGIIDILSKIDCTLFRITSDISNLDEIDGLASVIDFETDIRDIKQWDDLLGKVDILYHLAAQTSAVKAGIDPIADYTSNVLPLVNMLVTCDKNQYRPVIIFAGTVTEIGFSNCLPVDEYHYEKPVTIYDIHKLTAEKYLEYYSEIEKVKGYTLRLANVYGPGKKNSSSDRGIVNLMVRKAINGEGLTVYGNGNYQRDYLYIDDVVNAFLSAGTSVDMLNCGHYIIGKGDSSTIAELANFVADRVALKTGKRVPISFTPAPLKQLSIENRNFVADNRKFARMTGWQPRYNLAQGIDRTIEVFLQSI